jgi:hypothetical protein
VLEGGQALVAELLAVAQEEGALELAGVGNAAQEVDRDERLARAGREAEQGARLPAGELLEDRADRGVLVVAPGSLAPLVRSDERSCRRGGEVDPDGVLVGGAEVCGRREFGHRAGHGSGRGAAVVVERPLVAIRGDHERDVQSLRRSPVGLRLVEAVRRGLVLALRLQDGNRHGLGVRGDLDPECVVRPAVGLATGLAIDDLDRTEGFLAADQVLGPAPGMQRRVDQLGPRLGLVACQCPSRCVRAESSAHAPAEVHAASCRSSNGLRGIMKDGGSRRTKGLTAATTSVGGSQGRTTSRSATRATSSCAARLTTKPPRRSPYGRRHRCHVQLDRQAAHARTGRCGGEAFADVPRTREVGSSGWLTRQVFGAASSRGDGF